jgi:hypothetical protein
MYFIKTLLPLLIVLLLVNACSDVNPDSKKLESINAELNHAGDDLKNAAEHIKQAGINILSEIRDRAIAIIESTKIMAQETAQQFLQKILKTKTYITDAVANTAEKLTSNAQKDKKLNN